MKRKWLTAMAVVLTVALTAAAAPPAKPTDKNKEKTPQAEVKHLYGLDWHTKLDAALKTAAGDTTVADKPVMVLRVLGDLDGFM